MRESSPEFAEHFQSQDESSEVGNCPRGSSVESRTDMAFAPCASLGLARSRRRTQENRKGETGIELGWRSRVGNGRTKFGVLTSTGYRSWTAELDWGSG